MRDVLRSWAVPEHPGGATIWGRLCGSVGVPTSSRIRSDPVGSEAATINPRCVGGCVGGCFPGGRWFFRGKERRGDAYLAGTRSLTGSKGEGRRFWPLATGPSLNPRPAGIDGPPRRFRRGGEIFPPGPAGRQPRRKSCRPRPCGGWGGCCKIGGVNRQNQLSDGTATASSGFSTVPPHFHKHPQGPTSARTSGGSKVYRRAPDHRKGRKEGSKDGRS